MGTVVGLFSSVSQAQSAVHQLRDSGIGADNIGLAMQHQDAAGNETTTTTATENEGHTGSGIVSGAVGGGILGGAAGIVVGLLGLTVPGVGPILAAGPLGVALSTGLVGAGIGAAAGGLVGALTNAGVPEEEATMYQTAVQRGGVLVTATVASGQEDNTQKILNDNGARNVHEEATRLNDPNYRYDTGSQS